MVPIMLDDGKMKKISIYLILLILKFKNIPVKLILNIM